VKIYKEKSKISGRKDKFTITVETLTHLNQQLTEVPGRTSAKT
jgi:hypothetical protein